MNCCSRFLQLLMLPWCSERPQNKRYSPRRKGKQSTNTTLHLFFCYHTGELFFEGGEGTFSFGMELQSSFPNNERGEFASATSIAAGVWFSYSKQRHSKNVLGLRTSNQIELRLYGVTHTISRSFKTQLNTHVY